LAFIHYGCARKQQLAEHFIARKQQLAEHFIARKQRIAKRIPDN
jgi:hypothetical protein